MFINVNKHFCFLNFYNYKAYHFVYIHNETVCANIRLILFRISM
jgi:hypothetical protein